MSTLPSCKESSKLVQMEHIYKTFNKGSVNEVVLFSDFNLSIDKGEFISVVGSNGSGKTTMLNILCGFTDIDSGRILLRGRYKQIERIQAGRGLSAGCFRTLQGHLPLPDHT